MVQPKDIKMLIVTLLSVVNVLKSCLQQGCSRNETRLVLKEDAVKNEEKNRTELPSIFSDSFSFLFRNL